MNEIIKITQSNINGYKVNSVNSRELYDALGLAKGQYARWTEKNIVGFFERDLDYIGVRHDVEGNIVTSYVVTIDTAKHLAMMARTKRGKKIRDYLWLISLCILQVV